VTASPARIFPPTNSLPPLRWPVGLIGIDLGDSGAEGDFGGTKNVVSTARGDGSDAPGLKENTGSAGDLSFGFSLSVATTNPDSCGSTADRGRRPVARENDEGAEEDDGREGKTKGGFGGGRAEFGDVCGLAMDESGEDILPSVEPSKQRAVSPSKPSKIEVPTITSGPIVAAIFQSRSAAPEAMDNSNTNG